MQLLRLEMKGFKSFADKTIVTFSPGMTAIVGPNGSGKSNITDAIRWVLGESNVRHLRGQKAEDIIFSGTEARKSMSAAEVNLVFDNSDGTLGDNLSEVVITRRIYRSGDSEFFINKRHCRLKDIHLLLADTGLGRDSMAIIGQNRIDAILNSKPEERRLIFEDVAGISRFKMNKEDALRRIESTNRNMERLGDMMGALEEQIEDLKEKAEKTDRFLTLEREKRNYDGALAFHEYKTADRLFTKQENETIALQQEQRDIEEELHEIEISHGDEQGNLLTLRLEQGKLDEEYGLEQSQAVRIESQIEAHIGQQTQLEEQMRELVSRQEQLGADIQGTSQFIRIQEEVNDVERTKLVTLEEQGKKLEEEVLSKRKELSKLQNSMQQLQQEQEKVRNDELRLTEDRQKYVGEIESLKSRLEEVQNSIEAIQSELVEVRKEEQQESISVAQVRKDLEISIQLEREQRERLQLRENELGNLHKNRSNLQQELQRIKGRLDVLQGWEEDHEGYLEGTKRVITEKETWSTGIIGAVGDLFSVDKKFVTAIDIALGGSIQHVVTSTSKVAGEAVQFLKKQQAGRVTFLPLDAVKGKVLESSALTEEGVLGRAVDCVSFDLKHIEVFKYLLGRTIVVDTFDRARSLQQKYQQTLRIITLEGEQFHPGGSLTGGIQKKKKTSLLARRKEQESLHEQYESTHKRYVETSKSIETIEVDLGNLRTNFDTATATVQRLQVDVQSKDLKYQSIIQEIERKEKVLGRELELKERLIQLSEEAHKGLEELEASWHNLGLPPNTDNSLQDLMVMLGEAQMVERESQERLHSHDLEVDRLRLSIEHRNGQIVERREAQEKYERELTDVSNRLLTMKESLNKTLPLERGRLEEDLRASKERIQILQEKRSSLGQLIQEKEGHLQEYFSRRSQLDERNKVVQRRLLQMQENLTKYKMNGERSLEILSELGFTKEEGDRISLPGNVQQWKDRQSELQLEIQELGLVNPNAIAEYEEAQEKMSFYGNQLGDLDTAKHQLEDVIQEIDGAMSTQLMAVLDEVRVSFQKVFSELFGGGTAQIVVSDESNILQSGIDFYIQPPGKKRQQLTLLSGGERALTVIALLFSFLAYRPAPFCVLDEVDAALDEANVDRFSSYLHRLSKDTQFIVVSHRKRTMESAQVLQGVTMAERGISRLLTVTFDEVKEEASYGV